MILHSKPFVEKIEKEILRKTRRMKTPPVLGIVLVGNDPASLSYIKRKEEMAKKFGCESKLFHFPTSPVRGRPAKGTASAASGRLISNGASEKKIISTIKKLNNDKKIKGIIVQLPLPAKFDTKKIISAIKKEKDVDNLRGDSPFTPPAVQAIWQLLCSADNPPKKSRVLIVGYGPIIGRPTHSFLLKKGFADIKIADSKTKNLSKLTKEADIIISGAGKANLIKNVKDGAIVIDAGASLYKGRIAGDVDMKSVAPKAKLVTPVPGGVGPLTVAYLFLNLVRARNKF